MKTIQLYIAKYFYFIKSEAKKRKTGSHNKARRTDIDMTVIHLRQTIDRHRQQSIYQTSCRRTINQYISLVAYQVNSLEAWE